MKTDIEIIEEILNGKNDYFSLLMEKYHNEIFKYVYNILGNYQTTEDLLQETLLAGISGIEKFNGQSTVGSWLVGILKHKIMDYYRKSQREL